MELRHFRYFLAAAEHRQFAHAAEALGISPPSLTVQIQDMERLVGTPLFLRSRRGIALTPAGEAFLPAARAAVEAFDRALVVGQKASHGEIGQLAIGYVGSAVFAGVLQPQLDRFRKKYPDVRLVASEFPMEQIVPLIVAGDLDVGFIRGPVQVGLQLATHTVLEDAFCVALPSIHPLVATPRPVAARDLAHERFILPEQPVGTYEVARRGRFSPQVHSSPGGLASVLSEVALGTGVAVIPNVLSRVFAIPGVRFKRLAGKAISTGIVAVFRKNERYPAVEGFIRQLRSTPAMVLSGTGRYAP